MGGDEDVVAAAGAIPEGELGGDEVHGGGEKRAGVVERRESIRSAEITRHVDRDKEKIRIVGVESAAGEVEERLVERDLGPKQMGLAPPVCQPVSVILGGQIVDIDFERGRG